jgi:hypothetical protein
MKAMAAIILFVAIVVFMGWSALGAMAPIMLSRSSMEVPS